MNASPITYVQQDITIAQINGPSLTIPGFVADGTGLGYYIAEAPGNASGSLYELASGLAYRNYYVPVHLASGCQFGWYLFTEQHVKAWLELVVPLTDWTQPADYLAAMPEWRAVCTKARAALDDVTQK